MAEWSVRKKWNPFNSYKLLAHVCRWRRIEPGAFAPPPVLVTIDPVNKCNLKCKWCNSEHLLSKRSNRLSDEALAVIADGLGGWTSPDDPAEGVEAVCIAGGGEPLLHPGLGDFIDRLVSHGIEVGVVTNGTNIHNHLDALSKCTWVGVSVDAGTADTFAAIKGVDAFGKVTENIALLCDHAARTNARLALDRPGYGVSYKYLLDTANMDEIVQGARIARDAGCRNFHLRPAGIPWDKLRDGATKSFAHGLKEHLDAQLDQARAIESEQFGVYGIVHKFDDSLNACNRFSTCTAVFMTAVFMPPRADREELFSVGLCCDRRGDERMEFQAGFTDFGQLMRLWGGPEHRAIYNGITIASCPRCTYQPHNQIYETVIQQDSMTYRFI
jgi:hypothetical protein